MKVFISYSSKQENVAKKIKDLFNNIDISSFLANDDIRTAEDWKARIVEELQKCQIIIPILSKEFKESDWCSQELGIFFFQKKDILPISVDGTNSYGFINHIQSKAIKSRFQNDMSLELIVSEGLMEIIPNCAGFIYLLKKLEFGFKIADKIFATLEPFFDRLNKEDLNSIIEISIKNGQIWSAAECSNKHLPKLLELRKDDIDAVLREKIEYQIKNNKLYPN